MSLIIPKKYTRKLLAETTEVAIQKIKDGFQKELARALNLRGSQHHCSYSPALE